MSDLDPAPKSSGNLRPWLLGGAAFLGIFLLMAIGIGLMSAMSGTPLTDSQAAKSELTKRIEKVFAQRFSVTTDAIIVDLGSEDPARQLAEQKAKAVTVVVTANGEHAAAIIAEVAGLQRSWVTVSGGFARLGAGFDVPLMGKLDVGVTQAIQANGDSVTLTPEGFYLSGLKVPASELLGIPLVGDWIKQFTVSQDHCIVERVPNGFELTQTTINGATLEMTFTGEDVNLSLAKLQKTGSCFLTRGNLEHGCDVDHHGDRDRA